MRISCIIPCLNERHELPALLRLLEHAKQLSSANVEIIVVDGGSDDGTQLLAQSYPSVRFICSAPLRSTQMNTGALAASGDTLYFVHADTRPPSTCFQDIFAARKADHRIGGYPFEFDSNSKLLKFNSWLTGFNVMVTRGGDQSIFICAELFAAISGFRESMIVMEEYSLLRDAQAQGARYHLLTTGRTLVSARKYEGRSWARVQVANICAMAMWRLNQPSDEIRRVYARVLCWPQQPENSHDEVIARTYMMQEHER